MLSWVWNKSIRHKQFSNILLIGAFLIQFNLYCVYITNITYNGERNIFVTLI